MGKRQENKLRNRKEIVAAATQLFIEKGGNNNHKMKKMKKMKIKTTFLLFSLIFSTIAHTQVINFTDLANLPEARSAVSSANDGEYIYLVNGFGDKKACAAEIFKYTISTNTWSLLTNSTSPKRYASAAVIGQKLYVLNGLLLNGKLNDKLEVIDLASGAISEIIDNPFPVRAGGVATWNGKIYIFGGGVRPSKYSNKLMEFDPQTKRWTELATMPFAAETKGAIVNGKLYVFGGFNGKALDKMAIYNITTHQWEASIRMPVAISAHAIAILDDKIYLTGDYANLNSLIEYESTTNRFNILVKNNLKARRHCATEGVNGQLYVIGGNVTSKVQSSIASVQMAELGESVPIKDTESITEIEIFPTTTRDTLNFNRSFDFLRITDEAGKAVLVKRGNIQQVEVKNLHPERYKIVAKKNNKWHRTTWKVLSKLP